MRFSWLPSGAMKSVCSDRNRHFSLSFFSLCCHELRSLLLFCAFSYTTKKPTIYPHVILHAENTPPRCHDTFSRWWQSGWSRSRSGEIIGSNAYFCSYHNNNRITMGTFRNRRFDLTCRWKKNKGTFSEREKTIFCLQLWWRKGALGTRSPFTRPKFDFSLEKYRW